MKRGFTLLETVIAIALLSMCVIGFLQALNVAMLGRNEVRQNNAAAELARSQMEYIQQRQYDCNASSIPDLYGYVSEIPSGFTTADINTTVSRVSGMDYRAIQQITVKISYFGGNHHIELTDYKTPRLASLTGGNQTGWLVTEKVDLPLIPCGDVLDPPQTKYGYYYTFTTGTTTTAPGPISASWKVTVVAIKGFQMYLYDGTGRSQFPQEDEGLLSMLPPSTGCISVVNSMQIRRDREVADIEMTDLPPDTYTFYFFNSGREFFDWICLYDIPPSKATISYIK